MSATLDHVGILVPRLEEAGALLERLGFTLTRRAEHRAASGESAGSAQRSIMLGRGYIEVQELSDLPTSTHILAPATRRNFGLHTLAFGVEDSFAARAAAARSGLPVGDVLEWGRRIEEEDQAAEARFSFFVSAYDAADDTFLCWVRHLTPDALRNDRLVTHPNGARALRAAVIAARGEPHTLLARYEACGGEREVDGRTVRFGHGAVEILPPDALPPSIAAAKSPARDWFAAIRIGFDDPGAFADLARREGFAVAHEAGALTADLRESLGCFVIAERAD